MSVLSFTQKAEKIQCVEHQKPLFQLYLGKNTEQKQRLLCRECKTLGDSLYFFEDVDKYLQELFQQVPLYNFYQESLIQFHLIICEQRKLFEKYFSDTIQIMQDIQKQIHEKLENIEQYTLNSSLDRATLEIMANFLSYADPTLNYNQSAVYENITDTYEQIKKEIETMNTSLKFPQPLLKKILNRKSLYIYQKFLYNQPIQLEGHGDEINVVAISKNEKMIASGDLNGKILIWDLDESKIVTEIQESGRIGDLKFSNNESLLAAAHFEQPFEINVYDLELNPPSQKYKLSNHKNTIFRIHFSYDSNYLISGSQDKMVIIWKLNPTKLRSQQIFEDGINGLDISLNQQYISVCCSSGKFFILKNYNLERLTEFQAHEPKAYGTQFTSDSQLVLTSGKEIKLWNVEMLLRNAFLPLKIFKGDTELWSIGLLHHQQILVSIDLKLKLWNFETGQLICQLEVPENFSQISDKTFCSTKILDTIIIAGRNKKLKLYKLKKKN